MSENVGNVSEIDKPAKEIVELKDKNNTLEKKLGLVTFDFEEIEVKYEALAKENEKLEEQIDNFYEAKRNITAELDSVLKENSNFKAEISKIDKQKTNSNLDKSTIKKELQEKSDLVEILEHTLKNRESEIERLREELSYAKSKIKGTTLNGVDIPCSICSFANELQLRRHIEKVHDHKCEKCGYISFNLSRLETHTRIYHVWETLVNLQRRQKMSWRIIE